MGARDDRPDEPILHVDMDAFYASVEARDDPRLRGRPVIVGGTGNRGVVASASYEARAFGVRSAMPMSQARRRCPGAAAVAPRFDAYRAASHALHDIFRSVTPLVEPLALDEAFLDVGGSRRLFGEPDQIATMLRRRIRDELQLPASVGVAPNKFLAKLCSQRAKPDGVLHLRRADVDAFLLALPVDALWGVGGRTAERLEASGITTVRDIRNVHENALARIVGSAAARSLRALAHGIDDRAVEHDVAAKGLSAEQTFATDLTQDDDVAPVLLDLADRVARRLREGNVRARTVSVKVRESGFVTHTRARTLAVPTDSSTDINRVARVLVGSAWSPPTPLRLLGIAASGLVDADDGVQLDLLSSTRTSDADRVADQVRAQFGAAAMTRGALLGRERPRAAPTRDDLATGEPG